MLQLEGTGAKAQGCEPLYPQYGFRRQGREWLGMPRARVAAGTFLEKIKTC
jgi:hypothetical protein